MILLKWDDIPFGLQRQIVEHLGRTTTIETRTEPSQSPTDNREYESATLTGVDIRQLLEGLSDEYVTLFHFMCTNIENGYAYVSCDKAEALFETNRKTFAQGPLAGIHRRLRSVTGKKNARLIFRYNGSKHGEYDTYYIDNSETISELRRYLKIESQGGK